MKTIKIDSGKILILVILIIGCSYLFFLQSLTPDGVFFSGDSGLKAMLTQSLARGNWNFDLDFMLQPWVKALWSDGMIPYQEPYFYHLNEKYYISYPFTFPLVTLPFYLLLGYRGLYVIPVVSTLIVWLLFYWACKKLKLRTAVTALGWILLIFASNLTLYSAMFWEHTLAVCLSFAALVLVMPTKGSRGIHIEEALGAGFLASFAVWFRPELIFTAIFLDGLALWAIIHPLFKRIPGSVEIHSYLGKKAWLILASSLSTLAFYVLSNFIIYKNFLGMHAIQVIETISLRERIASTIENLQLMTIGSYSFFVFLPIAIFLVCYLIFAWFKRETKPFIRQWTIWYVFILLLVLGVSALVPPSAGGKQWGARFLLLLVPVCITLFAWQLDTLIPKLSQFRKGSRWAMIGLIVTLSAAGIYQNLILGVEFLNDTYQKILPAVTYLRTDSRPVIAISNEFIGQVLQPGLPPDRVFVRITNETQLAQLSAALLAHNQTTLTYICYSSDCEMFKSGVTAKQVEQKGLNYTLQVINSGNYGKYSIFDMRINR